MRHRVPVIPVAIVGPGRSGAHPLRREDDRALAAAPHLPDHADLPVARAARSAALPRALPHRVRRAARAPRAGAARGRGRSARAWKRWPHACASPCSTSSTGTAEAESRTLERTPPLCCAAAFSRAPHGDRHVAVPQRPQGRDRRRALQHDLLPAREAREGRRVRAHEAQEPAHRQRDRAHLPERRAPRRGRRAGPAHVVPLPGQHGPRVHGQRELRPDVDPARARGRRPRTT